MSGRDNLAGLLEQLCPLPGPAGAEDAVRDWLARRWAPSVNEITVTATGNLLARVGGSGRRVVLLAHMDEITYFVTVLRDDGLVEADPLRTWPPGNGRRPDIPLGHPAVLLARDGDLVHGTFAGITGHLATDAGESDDRWWIDVGCSDAAELAAAGLHVGAPVVSGAPVRRAGDRVIGKAMDDRALLAVLTALLERPGFAPRNELWVAATTQEEVGAVGASWFGDDFFPDVALTLDVAPCGRLPGQPPDRFPLDLGAGPVLVHRDISLVYDRAIGRELWSAAQAAGQPLQDGAFRAYFTDGREMVRHGAKVTLLALPCRYTHSSYETVDLRDMEALVDVLAMWA